MPVPDMWEVRPEPQFQRDYRSVMRRYPQLKLEFAEAVRELVSNGRVPEAYRPHVLDAPGGNYNGHVDFHLSDGNVDVLVLYQPHKTNPIIRLVRMGSHDELFRGGLR